MRNDQGTTSWTRNQHNAYRYALYGALFGLAFPLLATLGDLYLQGMPLRLHSLAQVQLGTPLHWIIDTAPFFLGLFAWFAGRRQDRLTELNASLQVRVEERDRAIRELGALQEKLEHAVESRTEGLRRRARYLEGTAAVAREALHLSNVQDLAIRVVRLIDEHLQFYHTRFFLTEEGGRWMVLHAESDQNGHTLADQGCKVRVDRDGLLGDAIRHRQCQVQLDLSDGSTSPQDMLLPETRSVAALPMRSAGGVLGVLQVQEKTRHAFGAEDLDALQVMADQVATFVGNVRLLQQVRERVEAERQSHTQATRAAWAQLLLDQSDLGFRRDKTGLSRTMTTWRPQMERAARTGEIALGVSAGRSTLTVPVKVHDQVIGVIDARKAAAAGRWTKDEIELLETITEQLTLALDNARLYQAVQHRSFRDRQLRAISERMQEQADLDAMLQAAVTDLARALDVPSAFVQLNPGLRLPQQGMADGSVSGE